MTTAPQRRERRQVVRKYFASFDALRILAIIAIIAYHYYPQYQPGGFLGVDIFFVLSGFLIANEMMAYIDAKRGINFPKFILRRLIKLWWPIVIMLILSLGIINFFGDTYLYNVRGVVISALTFTNNWWQVLQGASYFAEFINPAVYNNLWYISVLMQLSLIFPILLALLWSVLGDRRRVSLVLLGIAILSGILMIVLYKAGDDPSRVYYGTDTRAYAFFLGAAGAVYWQPEKLEGKLGIGKATILNDIIIVLTFGSLISFSRHMLDQAPTTYRGGLLITALISTILVCALSGNSFIGSKVLSWPLFKVISARIYGIYLWYYPVYAICSRTTFIQKWPLLQFVILGLLAEITYRLSAVKLDNLRNWRDYIQTNRLRLVAIGLVAALSLSAIIGFVRAPSGHNQTVAEMEAQLAEAQRKIDEEHRIAKQAEISKIPALKKLPVDVVDYCQQKEVTFIGDSILLSAAKSIVQVFPKAIVDGKVGRQLNQSGAVIDELKKAGKLKDTVVIVLGSNGPFTESQLNDLIGKLDGKKIFFVNTHVERAWRDNVNDSLAKYVKDHPDTTLIDWNRASTNKDSWFYEDRTHCNEEGGIAFSNLVANDMYKAAPQSEKDAIIEKRRAEDAQKKEQVEKTQTEKDSKTQSESQNKTNDPQTDKEKDNQKNNQDSEQKNN